MELFFALVSAKVPLSAILLMLTGLIVAVIIVYRSRKN